MGPMQAYLLQYGFFIASGCHYGEFWIATQNQTQTLANKLLIID